MKRFILILTLAGAAVLLLAQSPTSSQQLTPQQVQQMQQQIQIMQQQLNQAQAQTQTQTRPSRGGYNNSRPAGMPGNISGSAGGRTLPAYEVMSIFPREISPGEFWQVDMAQISQLADQGWELTSVTPYVYRNEEHDAGQSGPKKLVTQVYPAYFFKRIKPQE